MDNRFVSKEWLNKRKIILDRDNFTCQNCDTFNPSLGLVEIYRPGDKWLEVHEYISNPSESIYRYSSQKTGITLEMDFGLDWLQLPIMQVHHKRYIEGKEYWDYDDSDLITLCKDCHSNLHEKIEIPVYDNNGQILHKKKFLPNDNNDKDYHGFKPWIFVNMHYNNSQREYEVSSVKPRVKFIMLEHEFEREAELIKDAEFMLKDFFETYLPDYKQ